MLLFHSTPLNPRSERRVLLIRGDSPFLTTNSLFFFKSFFGNDGFYYYAFWGKNIKSSQQNFFLQETLYPDNIWCPANACHWVRRFLHWAQFWAFCGFDVEQVQLLHMGCDYRLWRIGEHSFIFDYLKGNPHSPRGFWNFSILMKHV